MKSINDHQEHVKRIVKDKGFDSETPPQVFALLVEEIGELSKALRKLEGMKTGQHSKVHDIEEEASDVLFMLLDFCNRLGIDLQKAFAEKTAKIVERSSDESS